MEKPKRSGEFEIIRRLFAPLAEGMPGAFDLTDDAAVLDPAPGERLIVTADCLVEGVHFPAGAAPDEVAPKLIRVNISDLAAMGAKPWAYTLTTAFGPAVDDPWIERFAAVLGEEQKTWGIGLIGGDTVATPGPSTFTVTALGTIGAKQNPLRRNGACPGERVWVSGTVGDGALGLKAVRGGLSYVDDADRQYLIERYHRPTPRMALGCALLGVATAAIDVSDGLVADLGHICETSGVEAMVAQVSVPLSQAARSARDKDPALTESILTGGDDYELLFTAPSSAEGRIQEIGGDLGVQVTEIGVVVASSGGAPVRVKGPGGRELSFSRTGYTHS